MNSKEYVVGDVYWTYLIDMPAPRNKKIHILTGSGVSILGSWVDGVGYIAWSPLHKRDKNKEKQQFESKINV